jgi:DNA-binding NtrC family response regulator
MYYYSILVIDAGNTVGPALKKTIESSPFPGIVYLKQSAQELGVENYTVYLPKLLSIFKFDIAVLILPQQFQGLLQELKEWVQEQYESRLVLVIIENLDSSMAILSPGAKFHSLSQLSTTMVLSQIWHFVGQLHYRGSPFYVLPQDQMATEIIGNHPYLLGEMSKIPLAANADSNVFISGPPGTGKKTIAMKIHSTSAKSAMPFAMLCCPCCSRPFGQNSFLGLESTTRESILQKVKGGTLFLHEIESLSPAAQSNLLDFLESREYFENDTHSGTRTGFRVISSSVGDVEEILHSGKLQKNLFYRLNIISFKIPALKERLDDVPLLAHYFLVKFSRARKNILYFSEGAILKLTSYDWPGNVRELEYTIRHAVNLLEGDTIKASDIKIPVQIRDVKGRAGSAKWRKSGSNLKEATSE